VPSTPRDGSEAIVTDARSPRAGWVVLAAALGFGAPACAAGPARATPPGPVAARVTPPAAAGSGATRALDLQYGGSFCALRADGRVACWGRNAGGSLGDGGAEGRSRAALVPGLDQVRRLLGLPSRGFCALRADASLWCWGFGAEDDRPSGPTGARPIARNVVDFAFAEKWPGVCARHHDGQVSCTELRHDGRGSCVFWADDTRRTCLVHGDVIREVPRALAEAGDVRFGARPIPFGDREVCTLRDGRVDCRGSNGEGRLGDPSRASGRDFAPVPGVEGAVDLAHGPASECAVLADGRALCWGRNDRGEIGVPPDAGPCQVAGSPSVPCNRRPTPLPIAGVAQVALRNGRVFALTRAGEVVASCPSDVEGCVRGTFAPLAGMPPLQRMVSSLHSLCGLTGAGEVICFGDGDDVGDGVARFSRTPVPIPEIHGAVEVAVDSTGACARFADGRVSCWGLDDPPRDLTDVTSIGIYCSLARDGRVLCWGQNANGEMGLGRKFRPGLKAKPGRPSAQGPHVPLPVPGLRDVVAISSMGLTTCAVDRSGKVRCWGWDAANPKLSPTVVEGLPPVTDVWIGRRQRCALGKVGGEAWCWMAGSRPAPVPELGVVAHLPSHGDGADRLGDPRGEVCALAGGDAGVRCVGAPAQLPTLAGAHQLSVAQDGASGVSRGCVVLRDGQLRCWGAPYCARSTHTCAAGVWNRVETVLDKVRHVSVGEHLACAARTDGTVWCWGRGDDGGLGGPHQRREHVVRVDLDGRGSGP
jgi:alpha-tubulin suppressor-like RCC1 family protein